MTYCFRISHRFSFNRATLTQKKCGISAKAVLSTAYVRRRHIREMLVNDCNKLLNFYTNYTVHSNPHPSLA